MIRMYHKNEYLPVYDFGTLYMPVSTPVPVRLWLVAFVTGAGAFMAMLDATVANLAVKTIARDFSASFSDIQWIVTGYLISLAVSLPLTAWLGQRFGHNRVWFSSVLLFVTASVFCALAPNSGFLIAARCLQGAATGVMVPTGQAILTAQASRHQLGRLMGTVGFAVALGPAVGPGLGGVILEVVSWRWLFWINLPVGLMALWAAKTVLPASNTGSTLRFDHRGFALIACGLPLLLYGALRLGVQGGAFGPVVFTVCGVVFVAAFLLHATRTNQPLIHMGLFKTPGFPVAVILAGLTGATLYGGLLFFAMFLQNTLRQPIDQAGFGLLLMGLGSAIALPIAGQLTDRYGAAVSCMLGAVCLLLVTAPFLWPGLLSFWGMLLLLFMRGMAVAMVQMPAMTAAYIAVTKNQTADAATLINIVQRVGGAFGAIAVAIVVNKAALPNAANAGLMGFVVLCALAGGAIVAAGWMWKGQRIYRVIQD